MTNPLNKATFEECRQLIFKSSSLIEKINLQIKNNKFCKSPIKPFYMNKCLELLIENLKVIEQSKITIVNNKSDNTKLLDEARKIRKNINSN